MGKTSQNFSKAMGIMLIVLGIVMLESLHLENSFTKFDLAGIIIGGMGIIVYGLSEYRIDGEKVTK